MQLRERFLNTITFAQMEGLLQPQMVDAIYEGKSPGEIGILMQMMHAIGALFANLLFPDNALLTLCSTIVM